MHQVFSTLSAYKKANAVANFIECCTFCGKFIHALFRCYAASLHPPIKDGVERHFFLLELESRLLNMNNGINYNG